VENESREVVNTTMDPETWPRATVVVVNYNGQQHLEECFRSLQELNYPAGQLELMLVDNASSDNSVTWVRSHFPRVVIVENQENYGFGKGNNIGAERATGELVAFLNSDMRVASHWLVELVRPLQMNPDAVCVGSRILTWDGRQVDFGGSAINFYGFGYQLDWGKPVPAGDPQQQASAESQAILAACGGAMLVRRREFLAAGGFDEDFFSFYEDTDLGWRFWVLGYRVLFAPRSVTYHKHHGSWGKEPGERIRVLVERNSFFSLLKNYDDEHLQQVLPAALLLLLERAYLSSGVSPASYRIGPTVTRSAPAPLSPTRAESNIPTPRTGRQWLADYWQATIERIRHGQFDTIYPAIRNAATLHVTPVLQRAYHWLLRRLPGGQSTQFVPRQTLSYLIAADDIIALYPKMLEKRRVVQAQRRRSDADIFSLFRMPLEISYFSNDYRNAQRQLEHVFEVEAMFAQQMDVTP
jgi:GT2 family glycosyltransferase